MFNFIAIARALRLLRAGISDKNLTDIVDAAVQLGTLFGFGKETEQLARVIEAKTFADGVHAAGEFLLMVATHLATGVPTLRAPGESVDDLESAISAVEALGTPTTSTANIVVRDDVEAADAPPVTAAVAPLPLILAILQMIRLFQK